MEQINLASFSFDTSEILKGASDIKNAIDEIKAKQKTLEIQGERNSEQYIANAQELKALNSQYKEHTAYLVDVNRATETAEVRQEALNGVLSMEVTTIKGLREQNKMLNQLRNTANITTEEGRLELEALNAQLDENNKRIKENVDQYTQQKIGIGDYASGIKSALSEMNPFNVSLSVFITNAQNAGGVMPLLSNGLKAVTSGIMGMTRASLAFLATPIGAVIGVLGVTLGLIINYLKNTQAGIDAVTAVTRPLQAIMQSLIGVLQSVGKYLFEAFSNPKQVLIDLVDFIKNNVINRFKAFAVIIEAIANRDFKGLRNGIAQAVTGVENLEDKIMNGAKATAQFLTDAAKKGQEIDRLQKQIEKAEIDIVTSRAENTLALKEQETIMQNQLASSQDRTKAVEEHKRLTIALIAEEEAILQKKIQQLQIQQSIGDTTREDLKTLAELQAQLIKNQEKRTEAEKKANSVIKQLRDENIAKEQKAIDARLKKEKELTDLYIQQVGTKARTLSEELEIERTISNMKIANLKNELKAKKISQEQYATQVLAIGQNIAKMEAELAIETASRELTAMKRGMVAQMEERKFLSDAVVAEKTNELNRLMEAEKAFQELRLSEGLINQQEFDDAIYELSETNRIAIAEINKEREAVEKQEAAELRALAFEEELERLIEEGATKFEVQREQQNEQFAVRQSDLDAQLEQGAISQELYAERIKKLNRDRANAEKAMEKALVDEKLALATGLFDAAASFIDKDSAAGKSIALAKAGINMYQGISAGVALGFPASIPAVAFAAGTGLKAIKDITSTKIPSASGTGSVGGAGGQTGNAINITGQGVNLGSSNVNVQNQVEDSASNATMIEQMSISVYEATKAGTSEGSQEGIVNLSANRQIQNDAKF